jgi:hypothetical protein
MNRFLVPLLLLMRDNAFYISIFKHSSHQLFDKPKFTIKLYNPDTGLTHKMQKEMTFLGTCIGVLDLNDSVNFHEMTLDDRIEIDSYSYWNYNLDILNLQPTSSLSYDENIMYDSEDEDEDGDKEKEQHKDECFEDNCNL